MFQPLFESDKKDMLFFSPEMIMFSNPERNLQKLWARRYPNKYNEEVAKKGSQEELLLEQKFFKHIENVKTVSGKEVKKNNKTLGDLDVGVYDTKTKSVLLVQLKWIMEPDSIKETRNSDERLNVGLDQLDKINTYINENSDWASEFFSEKDLKVGKIYSCVVSTSSTGSFWADNRYPIFSRDIMLDILEKNQVKSVDHFYKMTVKKHTFKSYIDYINIFDGFSYNGYNFFGPATSLSDGNVFLNKLKHLIFGVIFKDNSFFWIKQHRKSLFNK